MTRLSTDRLHCLGSRQNTCKRFDIPCLEARSVGIGNVRRQHTLPLCGPYKPLLGEIEQANFSWVHVHNLPEKNEQYINESVKGSLIRLPANGCMRRNAHVPIIAPGLAAPGRIGGLSEPLTTPA